MIICLENLSNECTCPALHKLFVRVILFLEKKGVNFMLKIGDQDSGCSDPKEEEEKKIDEEKKYLPLSRWS